MWSDHRPLPRPHDPHKSMHLSTQTSIHITSDTIPYHMTLVTYGGVSSLFIVTLCLDDDLPPCPPTKPVAFLLDRPRPQTGRLFKRLKHSIVVCRR